MNRHVTHMDEKWVNYLFYWRLLQQLISCVLLCDRFHWNGYTLKIHQIEKLRILSTSRYKFRLRFRLDSNLYREIWVSIYGGSAGCSILSGNCHRKCSWVKSSLVVEIVVENESCLFCDSSSLVIQIVVESVISYLSWKRLMYHSFHWNCYTPKISPNSRTLMSRDLASRFQLRIWFNLNLYR